MSSSTSDTTPPAAATAASSSSSAPVSLPPRLDPDATTYESVLSYYSTRALQAAYYDWIWSKKIEKVWIQIDGKEAAAAVDSSASSTAPYFYETTFISPSPSSLLHYSFYLPHQHRGSGLIKHLLTQRKDAYTNPEKSGGIVTIEECGLEDVCRKFGVKVVKVGEEENVAASSSTSIPNPLPTAYSLITTLYGSRRAARTSAFYMNHVDEGLLILKWRQRANKVVQAAYAIHPLLQGDADLVKYGEWLEKATTAKSDDPRAATLSSAAPLSAEVILLAMEYRRVANSYLSPLTISSDDEFLLSPLPAVNEMLVADKIQNYKDFLRFHAQTHPQRERLQIYFKNWLRKLDVSLEEFEGMRKRLEEITSQE